MTFDLEALLGALEGVEFILVGGVAAAVQGAPVITQDVDILYRLEHDNLVRLEKALLTLQAVVRDDPRRLRFGLSHLQTKGHKLTSTMHGPLDLLGSVNEEQLVYEDLLPHTERMSFGTFDIAVLRLQKLIELKRRLARPKDLAALPILEATQRERDKL